MPAPRSLHEIGPRKLGLFYHAKRLDRAGVFFDISLPLNKT